MSTSGSYDFTLPREDLVYEAMYTSGVLAVGETPSAEELFSAVRQLNMMVKSWSGSGNAGQRGLKVWARKRATLFMEAAKAQYSLGPTGDHATRASVNTTLSAAALAGAMSVSVASDDGIADADILGVMLSSGAWHWDTVSGTPAGDAVTLTTGLAGAASSAAKVVAYTSLITRPTKLLSVLLRDSDGNDLPLSEMTLEEYQAIVRKGEEALPTAYYYEAQLGDGVLYLDYAPDTGLYTLEIVYQTPLADFDSLDDDPDFPEDWFDALHYNLAKRLCIAYGKPVSADLEKMARESLGLANEGYPETTTVYFQPGIE